MPRRRPRPGLALLLLGLAGPAASRVGSAGTVPAAGGMPVDPARSEQRANALKRVSEQLVCQCGCKMILSECNHVSCPFALPERERILAMLDAGKSDQEIIDGYVASYGRPILSAPPSSGSWLDRLIWVLPFLALLVAVVVVGRLVLVYNRRYVARPPSVSQEEIRRVEEELRGEGSRG